MCKQKVRQRQTLLTGNSNHLCSGRRCLHVKCEYLASATPGHQGSLGSIGPFSTFSELPLTYRLHPWRTCPQHQVIVFLLSMTHRPQKPTYQSKCWTHRTQEQWRSPWKVANIGLRSKPQRSHTKHKSVLTSSVVIPRHGGKATHYATALARGDTCASACKRTHWQSNWASVCVPRAPRVQVFVSTTEVTGCVMAFIVSAMCA